MALNIYLPSALIGFLCLLLSFPMGMKADLEFNAKCELPCIPMYCITTGDTRLPEEMVFAVTILAPRSVSNSMEVRATAMKSWQGYKRTK